MKYHATVYYRTHMSCNAWMVDVAADSFDSALVAVKKLFAKRRPRALRIDSISIVPEGMYL